MLEQSPRARGLMTFRLKGGVVRFASAQLSSFGLSAEKWFERDRMETRSARRNGVESSRSVLVRTKR